MTPQKVTTHLWFDRQAEEAVKFYTSIFKNSGIGKVSRYGKAGFEHHGMPEGTVMTIEFWIEDRQFLALNGGPVFKFNESISFIINCDTQEEIDYYWEKLTDGGDAQAQMCGWLKDKYGVSWQVVPANISELMSGPNAEKVMEAVLGMKKLDIGELQKAAE